MKFKNLFCQYKKKKERLKYKKELLNFFGKHLFQWDDLFSYINKNLDIDLKLLEIYQEYTHLSEKSNPDIAYKKIIKPKENEIAFLLIKNFIQFPINWNKIKTPNLSEIKDIFYNQYKTIYLLNKQYSYYPKLYQHIHYDSNKLSIIIQNIYNQVLNNIIKSDSFLQYKKSIKYFYFWMSRCLLLMSIPYILINFLIVINWGSLGSLDNFIDTYISEDFLTLLNYISIGSAVLITIIYLIKDILTYCKQYFSHQFILDIIYSKIELNFNESFLFKINLINEIIPIHQIGYQNLSKPKVQNILLNILNLSQRNPSMNCKFNINQKDNIEHELLNIQHQMETEIKRQIMV